MRVLSIAIPLVSTAAFAQNDPSIVRELDALESSSAVGTQPPAPAAQIRSLRQSAHQRMLPRTIALPALTNSQAALSIPAPALAPAPGQPLQIGVARALSDTANAAATAGLLAWTRAADGSLRAAISVRAPGAKGLRLGLRIEQLPPGTLLSVYGPDTAETTEITAAEVLRTIQANLDAGDNSAAAHTYWLPLVEGEETALEIQLPAGVSPTQLKVSLPTVSHLTMLPNEIKASGIGAAGSCNIDATCTSGNQNEMRAVAQMSYVYAGGSYYCTGTLLNNTKQDRTPYFLTANHCISTQTAASTLQTNWNFRSGSCGSLQTDSSYQRLSGGATLLYNTTSTDTSFLRLNNNPPSTVIFAGWNSKTPAVSTGAAVFGLHHPSADLQKYSEGAVSNFATCTTANAQGFSCSNSNTLGANTFYNVTFSRGVTEGGSSGSALFTADNRKVIGQLYGGNSSCANPRGTNYYGRFDLPFNAALHAWLSPTAAAVTYTVTASAGAGGTINPSGAVSVTSGATKAFTVTPNSGYSISSVGGSCGGTLNGNTYTTSAITGNCTVTASFAASANPLVTVYEHINRGGNSKTYYQQGFYQATKGTLGIANDSISSIEIYQPVLVTLYEDDYGSSGGGRQLRLTKGVYNLTDYGFNDVTSAISIDPNNSGVILFENTNKGGSSIMAYKNVPQPNLVAVNFNDKISSISVPSGFTITLYENSNYSGNYITFGTGTYNLTDYSMRGTTSWNDQVSSYVVR